MLEECLFCDEEWISFFVSLLTKINQNIAKLAQVNVFYVINAIVLDVFSGFPSVGKDRL